MAFVPLKQYKVSVTGSASSALSLPLPTQTLNRQQAQIIVYAKTTDIVVKLGGSTVAASATYTSSALPDKNFTVPAGQAYPINLEEGDTYVSAIAEDGATSGTLYVTVGYKFKN